MNINPTPEQERIVNDELKSGHFRSAEEVIAKALVALREEEGSSLAGDSNGRHGDLVFGTHVSKTARRGAPRFTRIFITSGKGSPLIRKERE
ncbi:MAG TPA: hypothetical protein VK302_00015 [Terriglobales bacterium]|nr:hypothetical protein [Terriglobales bacterium]